MWWLNCGKALQMLSILVVASVVNLPQANGANILGLFTSHSPSHFIIHMSVVKALAEKGHNITVVSSLKPVVKHPAIKHIIIPPTEEQEREINEGMKDMASQKNNVVSTLIHLLTSVNTMITMQVDSLLDERFTRLYDEKFDLVIVGIFFNDFQLGVAAKFNCPVVVDWMSSPMEFINDMVGNPPELAYVPNMNIAVEKGITMTFPQRMQNFLTAGIFKIFKLLINNRMESYYKQIFPTSNFPTYNDMKKNVSLAFCNSHFSEGMVRPNVPAIVEVGGIQIKAQPDPLPKDIENFIDSAQDSGFILFCLGSNLKGSNIKPEIIQTIFKTLSSLKQKVIWKWEDLENLPGKSPNILYKKWLPQDDILAHPNIKLFITHAGKGGIAEAQYHAVPMVALPVFADQPGNADKMVVSGYGKKLDLLSLNEKDFKEAILEVLGNPIYKENVKRFSELYRDRPITAKESVVYWTEYVLRHHGAKHMQSPLVHLNFFQSLSLDIIAALLFVAFIVYKIIRIICKLIYRKLTSKRRKTGHKKIKKN